MRSRQGKRGGWEMGREGEMMVRGKGEEGEGEGGEIKG